MKTRMCLVLVLSFIASLLMAQTWAYDTVIRPSFTLNWDKAVAHDAQGNSLVAWTTGNKNLKVKCLHPDGTVIWERDISESNNIKTHVTIVPSTDISFFVCWNEWYSEDNQRIRVMKITSGNVVTWGIVDVAVNTDYETDSGTYGFLATADEAGGLYVNYNLYANDIYYCYMQHISSWGSLMISGAGMQLSNSNYFKFVSFSTQGQDNSEIVLVNAEYAGGNLYRVAGNQVTWSIDVESNCDMQGERVADMRRYDNDHVMLLLTGTFNTHYTIELCMLDMNGGLVMHWQEQSEGVDYDSHFHIMRDSDANIFVSSEMYVRKFTPQFSLLWTATAPEGEGTRSLLQTMPDNEGGCYLPYRITPDDGSDPYLYDFNMQKLSSTGSMEWQGNGVPIIEDCPMQTPLLVSQVGGGGYVFSTWYNVSGDVNGLYMQCRTPGGALYSGQSSPVAVYTNGGGQVTGISAHGDNVMVSWVDDRAFNYPDYELKLYYQIVQPNGAAQIVGGALLSNHCANNNPTQTQPIAQKSLPDGTTVIFWCERTDQNILIKGQIIGANGFPIWGADGRTFATLEDTTVHKLTADYYEDAVYLSWTNYTGVRVQKIADWQPQWGTSGIVAYTFGDQSATLVGFKSRCLVLKCQDWATDNSYLYAKYLQPDGTPVSGWENGIVTSTGQAISNAVSATCGVMPDGKVAVVWPYCSDWYHTRYLFDYLSSETPAITPHELTDYYYYQVDMALDTSVGLTTAIQQFSWNEGDYRLAYTQRDAQFGFPWGEALHSYSYAPESLPQQLQLNLTGFSEGGFALTRLYGSDVRTTYINENGSLQNAITGTLIHSNCLSYSVASVDNEMYYTFLDNKMGISNNNYAEVRLHKYANPTTDTPVTPEVIPSLDLSAYPNPFTSSLILATSLPEKAQTEICIYNIRGQKVKTLTNGIMDKGTSTLTWDGKDDIGSSTASGIYFVRVSSGSHNISKKIIRY